MFDRIELSCQQYHLFEKKWLNGDYLELRYGQAFYQFFKLEKCADPDGNLNKLYNADLSESRLLISKLFTFS